MVRHFKPASGQRPRGAPRVDAQRTLLCARGRIRRKYANALVRAARLRSFLHEPVLDPGAVPTQASAACGTGDPAGDGPGQFRAMSGSSVAHQRIEWTGKSCVRRQSTVNHRRHGFVRQRRAAALSADRRARDPHLQPRREEAGRPAQGLRQRQAQVPSGRRARSAVGGQRDARRRLRLPRGGAEAGAVVRVPPDGGGQDQRDRHRARAGGGHPVRRAQGDLPVHRQGGVPDQRHGHFQGDDGKGVRGQVAQRGPGAHHHLRHPLRQRDGVARLGDPAVRRADPVRPAADHHRSGDDALHDDAGRRRRPGAVRLRARPQRRHLRAEVAGRDAGRAGARAAGGAGQARSPHRHHRHAPRREGARDAAEPRGTRARAGAGPLLPRAAGPARPQLRQVLRAGRDSGSPAARTTRRTTPSSSTCQQ